MPSQGTASTKNAPLRTAARFRKTSGLSDLPLQSSIDKKAREIRIATATRIAKRFLEQYDEQAARVALAGSPFRDHSDNFNHDRPLECLAFTLAVTEAAFKLAMRDSSDLLEAIFLSSRVVELGGHSISDPNSPGNPSIYLGAAKQHGYFFTPASIAVMMAEQAIGTRERLGSAIDPAAGCGALLAALLFTADRQGVLIEEVHGIERDGFTARLMRQLLQFVVSTLGISCRIQIDNDDALSLFHAAKLLPKYDCVVMNPPYGRIKFLRSSLTNAETRVSTRHEDIDTQDRRWKERTATLLATYKRIAKSVNVACGPLDYQRLFIAVSSRLLTDGSRCVFIAPSSWMSDRDGLSLRRQVIGSGELERLDVYAESCGLFATVNQPTAVACLTKGRRGGSIHVAIHERRAAPVDSSYTIDVEKLMQLDPDLIRIPKLSAEGHGLCEYLQSFPRLKSLDEFCNARGELDLTLGKAIISKTASPLRLVRGDHIERYVLRSAAASESDGYVDDDRFHREYGDAPKYQHFLSPRIACRQCAYIHKERRLSFTYVPARHVLANSCNYIVAHRNSKGSQRRLNALLVLLNSAVLEWYFRVFSGNNHVANYEIDDFPIPCNHAVFADLLPDVGGFLLDAYRDSTDGGKVPYPLEDVADALVAFAYGLTTAQVTMVFKDLGDPRGPRVAAMVDFFAHHGIPRNLCSGTGWHQHTPPTLSDLDREIIQHVPQGGNWMDVPASVPSKRLEQIRKMSEWRGIVRTTYYGRLRPEQPAYTIATYYNRPGNGTNIHPWANRTLTHREAARLQSFPDWYFFIGSDGSIRKQIGNAVPPLLAFALGTHLKGHVSDDAYGVVDLFAGAGGLSLGLELAGLPVIAAVEIDQQIGATYEFNRPCERSPSHADDRTLFLPCDLSSQVDRAEAIRAIRKKLGKRRLAAVMGGPPCQGFSHAGWRSDSDARNHLAGNFLDVVKALKPELAIIENVEGLLTFDDGKVVQDLTRAMTELGYACDGRPWVLCAEQYGVPQMRRRVFLVGSRSRPAPTMPPPFFEQCRGRKRAASERTLFETLPAPFSVGETLSGLPFLERCRASKSMPLQGRRHDLLKQWLQGAVPTSDLFRDT